MVESKNKDKNSHIIEKNFALFYFKNFDNDLRELVRKYLSEICEGHSRVFRDPEFYNYNKALKNFWHNYKSKAEGTKKGMVGELLSHIVILEFLREKYELASFSSNMEENNVKKGFDTVLWSKDSALWINEVKSGTFKGGSTCELQMSNLVNRAKGDLNMRLNKKEVGIWRNAVNGAELVLSSKIDIQNNIVSILKNIMTDINSISSANINVMLTGVLFQSPNEKIKEEFTHKIWSLIKTQHIFKDLYIVSIQKKSHIEIADFFKNESEE